MKLETIIQGDISSINRNLIKKRVSIEELLKHPVIIEGHREIKVEESCIKTIVERCHLPLSEIKLPITFFVPAGLYEGYVLSETDARVLRALGVECSHRGGKYWLGKHIIRSLERNFAGCFQSMVLP
jgi:uncharacterized protein (UPF0216 family)